MIDFYKFKYKIIEQAIKGEMSSTQDSDTPVEEYLKKIFKKRKKEFIYFQPENARFDIPKTWRWVKLDDYLDVRDGTHDTPQYIEKGYPLVTSKNINNGIISFDDVKFISKNDYLEINKRSKVDKGDILFPMIGSIGDPAIVEVECEFAIKNVALFKKVLVDTNEIYVKYCLIYFQKIMEKEAKGGLQSFVSLDYLRNFYIPLPPIEEQTRVVKSLDKAFAVIDDMEKIQSSIISSVDSLKRKIVCEIISGCKKTNKCKLEDVFDYIQPQNYIVSSTEYDNSYKTPVLTPGKSFILGYTDEQNGIYKASINPVIIFDDFTTSSRYVDFDFKVKSSAMKILVNRDINKYSTKYMYYLMQTINFDSSNHKRFWISKYSKIDVYIPNIEYQKRIVNTIDEILHKLDGLYL